MALPVWPLHFLPYAQLGALPKGSPELTGPSDSSNWVIPGHLMVGGWPGDTLDTRHIQILYGMLKAGMTIIVNLLEPQEISREVPYLNTLNQLIAQHPQEFPQRTIKTLWFPIKEKMLAEDSALLAFLEQLASALKAGEKLYIHCNNGCGRTGTITALLLVRLYGLSPEEALTKTAQYHDCKRSSPGFSSPQYVHEFEQVKRLAPVLIQRLREDLAREKPQAEQAMTDDASKSATAN